MTQSLSNASLAFYTTPPYACSYLPDRRAVTLFMDPVMPKNSTLHAVLSTYGFRRSGEHLYRPHCPRCQACIPVRVPVAEFHPHRNQQRTWRQNQDLTVIAIPPTFKHEHFQLYRKYLSMRHRGGGMDNPTPEGFMEFLTSSWADTIFYEFRLDERLLAVGVVDRMDEALSAVYTFFDPAHAERSLGRFAILYEIEQARAAGMKWLYLGYWIKECKKMRYKNEYQPLEYYLNGGWIRSNKGFACAPV